MTRRQKFATAYTDWAAGAASAPLGLFSFLIGAAASAALVNANDWAVTPVIVPIPTTSDDQGVLHNALCSNYMAQGFPDVNYNDVINVAVQVRPDLEPQIRATPEPEFNSQVQAALTRDLSTTQLQMDFLNSIVPLAPQDNTTVSNAFASLDTVDDPNVWISTVDALISQVPSFTASPADKNTLTESFQILRSSFPLWSEV